MKRTNQRAPSPTPTAFSGISSYRTDSYRPINKNAPAVPALDARIVARTHYDELSRYLSVYLARAPANSRSTARQKLTRLTKQQFQELSTDVYDELVRRKKNSSENEAVPFLPVRDDFHPKRNQARQKLATLPTSRFEDLSSDVYYELARRYPEFQENEGPTTPGSSYDDVPSPDFPTSPRSVPITGRTGRSSDERDRDREREKEREREREREREKPLPEPTYRKPTEDTYPPRRKPPATEDDYPPPRRSEDAYTAVGDSPPAGRRKPSQDTSAPRRSEDKDRTGFGSRASTAASDSTAGTGSVTTTNATSATGGMIIPTKSTIAEEEIEVPYGRDGRESGGTAVDERGVGAIGGGGADTDVESAAPESASEYQKSPLALGGLSGLSARLREEEEDLVGEAGRSGEEYYDKMSLGRASVASDRSGGRYGGGSGRGSALGAGLGGGGVGVGLGGVGGGGEEEKMRRDYEYKIATMQSRIAGLERDLGGQGERENKWIEGEEKVRVMEEELAGLRRRAEEQSSVMRGLQKELDELRRDKERDARRAREDAQELMLLRDRCERLESERVQSASGPDPAIVDQLRTDMQDLIAELTDLSRRNDELETARDASLGSVRELDAQVKEYKRKYELAKTELRSVKATSQLFLQAPKLDDQLPVSPDGGILDIHITAFLSSTDSLLTAGRSHAPTRVLAPMKAVVNAVSAIVEDVRLVERRGPPRDVDVETLRGLRDRAEATLSNLVAASRTHATSAGMAPVSLLDAAASHVSAAITEIGRTVCIRKATTAELDDKSSSNIAASAAYPSSPSLRTVGESGKLPQQQQQQQQHQKKASSASVRKVEALSYGSPSRYGGGDARRSGGESMRRPAAVSEPSSSDTNSPPPIFDQPSSQNAGGLLSDDSANAEGSEDAWAELKPYLEAQTESIVYAIQSVLSGVRAPTPSPTLNENLTQIITIVSSIVAVCNDNLPPASAAQGNEILRELSEHANKLSEVQAMPEVTKESRQIMAKSSFAVANAMKGLMKL